MFALPCFLLYSCLAQIVGSASKSSIRGLPPPGHAAFVHVANACCAMPSMDANDTLIEVTCWIEKPTVGLGHASAVPQSSAAAGRQTCLVPRGA